MAFVNALTHYFYPGYSNNHKAKLVHTSTLFLFTLLLIVYQVVLQYAPKAGVDILGYASQIPTSEVVSLSNQKRTEQGLGQLTVSPMLEQAARAKGQDMLERDYWAHVAPDGTEPWKFFLDAGYRYRYAGENLARDFSSAGAAVDAWMASPTHKDNLLSDKYDEIGIAVVEGDLNGVDTTIIVQLFGTKLSESSSTIEIAEASEQTPTTAPTLVPTAVPTQVPTLTPTLVPSPTPISVVDTTQSVITSAGGSSDLIDEKSVLISPFSTTKGISAGLITLLIGVLLVDIIIVAKKRIPRISGRTFAHIAFFGMVLAIILIAKAGRIL